MEKYKFIVMAMGMIFSFSVQAQSDQLIAEVLGQDPTVSEEFIQGMSGTVTNLNCDPWDDDAPCTDLCDPWDDNTPCPNTGLKTAEAQMAQIEDSMKKLENEMAAGEGGTVLNRSLVVRAQKESPGYSLKALKNRMGVYLKHLNKNRN